MRILVDHDIEGFGVILSGTLLVEGWLELIDISLVWFADVGLPANSDDRTVWRFAQHNGMILLTNNRNMKGNNSLEQTLREENDLHSLPVLTIGRVDRLDDKLYREQCVARIVEVVLNLENYLGSARIFIP